MMNLPWPEQVVQKYSPWENGCIYDLLCCIVAIFMFIIVFLVGMPFILFLGPAMLLAEVLVYERDRNAIDRENENSKLSVEGRVINIVTEEESGLERAVLQYMYQDKNYQTSRILTSLNRQYYGEIGVKVPTVLYSKEWPQSGKPQREVEMMHSSLPSRCKRCAPIVGAFVTAAMLLLMDVAIFVAIFGAGQVWYHFGSAGGLDCTPICAASMLFPSRRQEIVFECVRTCGGR